METRNVFEDYKNMDVLKVVDIFGVERAIWAMVIIQALRDVDDPKAPKIHIDSAHEFLSGKDEALKDICESIDVDYKNVVRWYKNRKDLK